MHEASDQPDFVKTVREIRSAEEESDQLISAAKARANELLRRAKEQCLDEKAKVEESIVSFKNERLHKGADEIELSVHKTIEKAKEDAAKTAKKHLDSTSVSKITRDFIDSLSV